MCFYSAVIPHSKIQPAYVLFGASNLKLVMRHASVENGVMSYTEGPGYYLYVNAREPPSSLARHFSFSASH